MLRIGVAGWSIRSEHAGAFGAGASHLARYATGLNAVEINSSFYRPHRPATYARWAKETPDGFSFAVKMPRQITHEKRLADAGELLAKFLGECGALGEKLGCILVQLPPSLAFDSERARGFFADLRKQFRGNVACEPRHASWFAEEAEELLVHFKVARVAADPAPLKIKEIAAVTRPGGFSKLEYWRLHGSPRIYYSDYPKTFLTALAERLSKGAKDKDVWCIFDNTALGHAAPNALDLRKLTSGR